MHVDVVQLRSTHVAAPDAACGHTQVFLEKGSPTHYMVGLKILNTLVTEMNNATPGRTLTQHRKVSGACTLSGSGAHCMQARGCGQAMAAQA